MRFRSLWILWIAVLAVLPAAAQSTLSDPTPAGRCSGDATQFVGVIGPATAGQFSPVLTNSLCDQQFPERCAHMCTTQEVLAQPSQVGVEIPDIGAWIHPVVVAAGRYVSPLDDAGVSVTGYRDYSGQVGLSSASSIGTISEGLSCNGWRSSSADNSGLLLSGVGIERVNCSTTAFISCCGCKLEPLAAGFVGAVDSAGPRGE